MQISDLLAHYYPIEIDSSMSVEEKIPHMVEWSVITPPLTLIHSNSVFSTILCFIPLRQVDASSQFARPTTNQERPAGSGCERLGSHVEVITHNASCFIYFC